MLKKPIALITGITGQTGSYLAEFLLEKGYEVHGIVRPVSTFNRERIDHIFDTPEKREKYLHYADLTDFASIAWVLKEIQPDEIYNLGALSHVHVSWKMPIYTLEATGKSVLNLLEAVRLLDIKCKILQASTSELFRGEKKNIQLNETSPKDPVSPYGSAKLYGFQITKNYREAYDMFICNSISFNHESKRRGDNFVTKKIINAIPSGEVHLGNLDASRDWGYALDVAEGMWLMLQQDRPDDYVLATGETHTIREFIGWVEELSGKPLKVIQDERYMRPHDVEYLCGSPNKAYNELGWKAKVVGKELVKKMLE
jgi:GDPmannose 4,6-dehydratase